MQTMSQHLQLPGRSTAESRPDSRATSSSLRLSTLQRKFGFDAKTTFVASQNLGKIRSDTFRVTPPPPDDDIWKRPAPDFRPQVYAPQPPKRNSRDAMQPWRYDMPASEDEAGDEDAPDSSIKLPQILQRHGQQEPQFYTRFRVPDPFEANVIFVKEGMFKPDQYSNPKPHDHRGLVPIQTWGLPEFDTREDHDPFDIHFRTNRLDIIHGLETVPMRDTSGPQMVPVLKQPPKWESRLILPTTPFPNRGKEYTRYRRQWRCPHSALMDRIEETLQTQWAKEKLEREYRARHQSCSQLTRQ